MLAQPLPTSIAPVPITPDRPKPTNGHHPSFKKATLPKSLAVELEFFPVDAQLLMLLPRAGASLRHADVRSPMLRSDPDGYYLEQRLEMDPEDSSELGLTRRIVLDQLSAPEWEQLKTAFAAFDRLTCREVGVSKGLEVIHDRRLERLLTGIMTFLNPRQVAIILHLYRLAAQQQSSTVTLRSNDLLQAFGYTRTKDGGFASKLRSQLHRDLVALHRTELIYPPLRRQAVGGKTTGKAKIKTILRIKDFHIAHANPHFDLFKAADYTYELADSYTIGLEFWEGIGRKSDCLWFPQSLDIRQPIGSNAKNDYQTRLLIYLASRLQWDAPSDGEYLILSKQSVFRNLDLLGSNSSRNHQIFWRTVEALKAAGYLLAAQELPGKKKINSIQFQVNSERLRSQSI
jgi:hypothetical protein